MNITQENTLVDENNKIEEAKESNVVDLKLIGGNNPPMDGDWLSPKEIGNCFLAVPKNERSNYICGLFRVVGKFEKVVVLASPSSPTNLYVIPRRFCVAFDEQENLGNMQEQEEQPVENADEHSPSGEQRNRDEGDGESKV